MTGEAERCNVERDTQLLGALAAPFTHGLLDVL